MLHKILVSVRENPLFPLAVLWHRIAPLVKNDELYLKVDFFLQKHKCLNLSSPKTYNEKLQWLKINDRRPEYTKMVDKATAKEFASEIMGEEFIVPTYGVWDSFDDIDFDKLPNQFVLKCTHNSGGTVICRDKSTFDKSAAERVLNRCLRKNIYWPTREYPYKEVKPRIIGEQFMDDGRAKVSGLTDYKFFCFNGIPKFLYVSQGFYDHSITQVSFFDLDGNRLSVKRSDYKELINFERPKSFEKMKHLVADVAKKIDAPFIRVDLYEVHGKIYFSEFTFFPCSGMLPFYPNEWDYKFGEMIHLPMV